MKKRIETLEAVRGSVDDVDMLGCGVEASKKVGVDLKAEF